LADNVTLKDTWQAMESLVDSGKVKNIGISNFNVDEIEQVLKIARIKPAVHQFECHPYLSQKAFLEYHKKQGIQVTAYSPFGNQNEVYDSGKKLGKLVEDPVLVKIGKKYGKSGAQVALAYQIARGVVVIPKSVNKDRIIHNLAGEFDLSESDVKEIDGLDKKTRFNNPTGWGKEFYKGLDK